MQDYDDLLDSREGVGDEYIGAQEDRIARKIIASEHVNNLRNALHLLHRRQKIDTGFYQDACDSLTYIDAELLDGKQAIVNLRNGRRNI